MGAFKLGKMTLGSLFKKPSTVLYPFEKKEAPLGLKGQIGIDVSACILCGVCERNCTCNCITVDKNGCSWSIDRYQCVQCGYCISVCPKSCLYMLPDYAAVAPQKSRELFAVPCQPKGKEKIIEAESKIPPAEATVAKREVPSQEDVAMVETIDETLTLTDYQLDDLIDLMDGDKAAKVRKALGI